MSLIVKGTSVYLGGTASANKLDDYEEGTWTPTFNSHVGFTGITSLNTIECNYTKIGRIVHLAGGFRTNSTDTALSVGNYLRINGQPFTGESISASNLQYAGSFFVYESVGSNVNADGAVLMNTADNALYFVVRNVTGSTDADLGISFSLTYRVD